MIEYKSNLEGVIKEIKSVNEKILKMVEERAKLQAQLLVPVDTGNLRQNIDSEVDVEASKLILGVLKGVDYAQTIELGEGNRQAQPFITPSLRDEKMIDEIIKRNRG